ncbi:MAG: endonuclease [Solibacillus sp.]
MNKIQALVQQLDAVLVVLPVCVAIERARLTEHYYKQSVDAYQTVSLAKKNIQVKNVCSSNE